MRALRWLTEAAIALSIYIAIGSSTAQAHPHVWIDLRSTVVLDDAGRITAIEQQWLFDPLYTVFATDELTTKTSKPAEALRALAAQNLRELHSYDYFTVVRVGNAKATFGKVSEFSSELRHGRLWMHFVVPLATPVDPKSQRVEFAVYDPSYYIEILHLQDDAIAFRGGRSGDCHGHVVPPNPPTEAIYLAAAMDRGATPDTTLGKLFAERVKITCR